MSASDLVAKLTALLGSEVVRSDAVSLQAYSRDATPMFEGLPEVIVAPRNTAEVSKIVKFAHDTKTPIIARGAGSNLCAATVPLNGGIVMSMTNKNPYIYYKMMFLDLYYNLFLNFAFCILSYNEYHLFNVKI